MIYIGLNPRRMATLPIGGDKTGDQRFYERTIPMADDLYDEHLDDLYDEHLIELEKERDDGWKA